MKDKYIPELIRFVNKISNFYFEKNERDAAKANEELGRLKIQNIVIKKTKKIDKDGIAPEETSIEIHCSRPGLLIGGRGENFEALEKYLDCKIHIEKVNCFSDLLYVYSEHEIDFNEEY